MWQCTEPCTEDGLPLYRVKWKFETEFCESVLARANMQ